MGKLRFLFALWMAKLSIPALKITHHNGTDFPGGAQASAVIYSLIETAKENGLDPYRYLLWVLQNAPQLSETDETWAEKLLPARAPKECYMPHK